jgi:hypothetical protein
MTPHQVRNRLLSHATMWIDYPQAYDGVKASAAVRAAQDAKSPWVRCTIQTGDSFPACKGSRTEIRRTGVVFLQVFVQDPEVASSSELPSGILASIIASSLDLHWQYVLLDGVETMAPTHTRVGPLDGYYQINVSVPYRT